MSYRDCWSSIDSMSLDTLSKAAEQTDKNEKENEASVHNKE